jgi:multidrug resistance efflux pump
MALDMRLQRGDAGAAPQTGADTAGDLRLWDDLGCRNDHARFGQAWLSITARTFPNIRQAMLFLPEGSSHTLVPAARWARDAQSLDLEALAGQAAPLVEEAMTSRRTASRLGAGRDGLSYAAAPLDLGGGAAAAAVVEARADDELALRRLGRHLQWAMAWVEAYLRRSGDEAGRLQAERAAELIDFVALTLEGEGLENVSRTLCSALSARFACDRVGLGRRGSRRTRLIAMSQSADLERRSPLSEAMAAAMDEAADQGRMLGSDADGGFVAYGQRALSAEMSGAHVLTVPLMLGEEPFGAVTLTRRSAPFTPDEADLIDAMLAPAAAVLRGKALADRSLPVLVAARAGRFGRILVGPTHLVAKGVTVLLVAAAAAAWFVTDTYRVNARGQVQGEVRRVVTAPFDGFLRAQHARAGETVQSDQLLAEMQDNDLSLDRLRHMAQRRQYQLDHDRALARRELAAVNVAKAQMDQKDAEIELTEAMLARTRLRAPFNAVIVSGDLSQQIGRPVSRGDVLFEVAPLDRYRLTLVVPELQIGSVKPGQTGQVLLTAMPEEPLPIEIESVTPVSRVAEGINGFEVLARIKSDNPRLRPSMEGVAKIEVGEARVVWIWTHQLWRWLHIRLWGWLP